LGGPQRWIKRFGQQEQFWPLSELESRNIPSAWHSIYIDNAIRAPYKDGNYTNQHTHTNTHTHTHTHTKTYI